jgi:hypothetical protein
MKSAHRWLHRVISEIVSNEDVTGRAIPTRQYCAMVYRVRAQIHHAQGFGEENAQARICHAEANFYGTAPGPWI